MQRAYFLRMFLLAFLFNTPAHSFVGEIDNNEQFPYVVRLESSIGGCTGVAAYNGLVSTAAHCVWDENGIAQNMSIFYKDVNGDNVQAKGVKIFFPNEFKKVFEDYHRTGNGFLLTAYDIAFIVPDRLIETVGFPHWGTEMLVPSPGIAARTAADDLASSLNGADNWTPAQLQLLDQRLVDTLGSQPDVAAAVVGFGKYFCNDYGDREHNCKSDNRRRFGQLPLGRDLEANGKRMPWVWCTKKNTEGINPIQHGDSGGPLFLRAVDGRWLYVGQINAGNSDSGCSSSLFGHFSLLSTAAKYFEQYAAEHSFQHTDTWRQAQIERFVREYFDSWSGPNEEALSRLKTFYLDTVSFYGKEKAFQAILNEKTVIAAKWPKRRYTVSNTTVSCNEFVPDKFCNVSATVDWAISNPDTGASKSGESQFNFGLNVWNMHYGYGGDRRDFDYGIGFGPTIYTEAGRTLTNNCSDCEPAKRSSEGTLWHHNGSTLTLKTNGTDRQFSYEEPRAGLEQRGVQKGTLLFRGKRVGDNYAGTAYIFTPNCGPRGYAVSGQVEAGDRKITMTGRAPRFDAQCKQIGDRDDNLTFSLDSDY
jgi:hypothetical protein